MNFKEILEQIEDLGLNPQTFFEALENPNSRFYSSRSKDEREKNKKSLDEIVGEVNEVHAEGQYDDGGESIERVYHFVRHNVYIKITGHWDSYDGVDIDREFEEVFPQEKKVIFYEKENK